MRTATTLSISPSSRTISAGQPLICTGSTDIAPTILGMPTPSKRATRLAPTIGRSRTLRALGEIGIVSWARNVADPLVLTWTSDNC